jgi:hypothetical protein
MLPWMATGPVNGRLGSGDVKRALSSTTIGPAFATIEKKTEVVASVNVKRAAWKMRISELLARKVTSGRHCCALNAAFPSWVPASVVCFVPPHQLCGAGVIAARGAVLLIAHSSLSTLYPRVWMSVEMKLVAVQLASGPYYVCSTLQSRTPYMELHRRQCSA